MPIKFSCLWQHCVRHVLFVDVFASLMIRAEGARLEGRGLAAECHVHLFHYKVDANAPYSGRMVWAAGADRASGQQ